MNYLNPATVLFLVGVLTLFAEGPREKIVSFLADDLARIWLVPLAIWLAYLLIGLLTGKIPGPNFPKEFLKLIVYFSVPTLLLFCANRSPKFASAFEIAAVLILWLPFDLRLITKDWFYKGSGYHVMAASATIYALVTFRSMRKSYIGARWSLSAHDARVVFSGFLILCAVLIPLGMHMDFLSFGINTRYISHAYMILPVYLAALATIFVGVAVPEELLFRGLLQNTIGKHVKPWLSIGVVSVMFGLAHINNGNFPNWKYVLMATVAGIVYGYVYKRTGSLLASAMVHTLVDATWAVFLSG